MEKGYKRHLTGVKKLWKRFWYFFWNEDSLLSWIVNIIVAFILIKWVIYPGLGLILGTSFPIVAVVSNSMDHDGMGFDTWWDAKHVWYEENNITQDQFHEFDFRNGFNKGDIMVLLGVNGVDTGDVVVFWGGKKEPIIHRVVSKWDSDSSLHFQTKGDRNSRPIEAYTNSAGAIVQKGTPGAIKVLDETDISRDDLVGKAVFRIPYLGYIKIWFIDLLMFLRIV